MTSTFDEYLNLVKERKLKLTNSRIAFIKAITSMENKHFTVNEIITKIKDAEGHVNIMSVYNILEMLVQEHLIFASTLDGKKLYYELITPKLAHIRCDYCGKLVHIQDDENLREEWWNDFSRLTKNYGVELEHYKIEAHGICDNCKEKNLSINKN